MDSTHIVTRFPPSPTGYLHIGGARTALFNWLYTKQNGGKFILRIEDTDEERSSEEATKAIIESMEWLGLTWDEGPYFQSKRYDLYNAFIEKLLKKGLAYHCHCSQEELNTRREEAKKKGLKPKYDGKCRNLGLGPGPGSVVRVKTPLTGKTRCQDLIKGPISFDNEELDDLIIRRSNGSPTYHLAVVADDIDLGVNVIIRGDDHVNNTPRQIQIYHAIGEPLPRYAHVPMILGPDKARLSKRHGAMSVLEYREMGYLPHALLNALVRLGWSYGDQEKFTMDELVEKFSLESVGKAAGVFNYEKLLDLNAQYIREASGDFLARELKLFLQRIGFEDLDTEKLKEVVSLLKMRSKTLVEMAEAARFFFEEDISFEEKGDKKFLQPEILPYLESL
ncbi:MAG: glutamate--tRNA ligase, partial [Desulfobulbaceae bacterium]|nr:glutamate--tRNA ligase [Desulfobulbaceae bacterium]